MHTCFVCLRCAAAVWCSLSLFGAAAAVATAPTPTAAAAVAAAAGCALFGPRLPLAHDKLGQLREGRAPGVVGFDPSHNLVALAACLCLGCRGPSQGVDVSSGPRLPRAPMQDFLFAYHVSHWSLRKMEESSGRRVKSSRKRS